MVRLERDLPPDLAGRAELSAAEYRALADAPPRRKYGNVPTEYNGVVYHSALEAACAAELDRLMATDPPLVRQVLRQRAFRLNKTGTVKLVVDFSLVVAGLYGTVELDAKGYETPVSRIKRAWFADAWAGRSIHVVRTPAEIEPLLRALAAGGAGETEG
jgi:hypothetical protein